MTDLSAPAAARHARTATFITFGAYGLLLGSWMSRTPAVRAALDLTSEQLGLLLLCMSAGSILGIPVAGAVVSRLGAAVAVVSGSIINGGGLVGLGIGLMRGSVPYAVPALVLIGVGMAVWDVGMNVEAADVEHRLNQPLMPQLHAGFSLGTVTGAGVGAVSAAAGIPLGAQVLFVAALGPVSMAATARRFLAARDRRGHGAPSRVETAPPAWREPRTLVIGLLMLTFAFTEGTANNWMAVAMVDGHGTTQTVGAVGFGIFVAAMTITRTAGGLAVGRYGRVAVVRTAAVVALIGLLIVVLGGSLPLVLAGAFIWGAGAALGFPVGMSAAADDPLRAASRVPVASCFGYTAFLGGPPLIGVLAGRVGILAALLAVGVALLVGLAVSGVLRPSPLPALTRTSPLSSE